MLNYKCAVTKNADKSDYFHFCIVLISIGIFVLCLNVFYDKKFSLINFKKERYAWVEKEIEIKAHKKSSQKVFNSCLWTAILIHLVNPWCLWYHTPKRLQFCTLVCSIHQVPPFRRIFQRYLGYWPGYLAPFMPTKQIASSLRRSFGPPFIMYTLAACTVYILEHWRISTKSITYMVSSTAASLAGVFFRPDNDWARTAWLVGPMNSISRRRAHSYCMVISTGLNAILFILILLTFTKYYISPKLYSNNVVERYI